MSYAAVRQYQDTSASAIAGDVSPHRQIGMLYAGALARLAAARGAMGRGDTPAKLQAMSGALAIIEHLQICLDKSTGGKLAQNLESLYEYMRRRLLHANLNNDVAAVDEVIRLLHPLQDAWDAIATKV